MLCPDRWTITEGVDAQAVKVTGGDFCKMSDCCNVLLCYIIKVASIIHSLRNPWGISGGGPGAQKNQPETSPVRFHKKRHTSSDSWETKRTPRRQNSCTETQNTDENCVHNKKKHNNS